MLGVVFVLIIAVAILGLTNDNNISDATVSLEDGLIIFNEEVCVDNFGNRNCVENTYVQCNGETLKFPGPTSYTVYEKIYETEYVETACEERLNNEEKPSPSDRIKDSDIDVFNNRIVINIKNPNWRNFIDSNSMDPLIDEGTTTIEIKPVADEIKVGDIISYNNSNDTILHRVVGIREDKNGKYYMLMGDNVDSLDQIKVRFGQIKGVVVGIIY